jgi:TP901 family phage tail tape measure protein
MANDIIFHLDGDAQGALDSIQQIIEALTNLGEALQAIAGVFDALNGLTPFLAEMVSDLRILSEAATNAANAFTDLDASVQGASRAFQAYNEVFAQYAAAQRAAAEAEQAAAQQTAAEAESLQEEMDLLPPLEEALQGAGEAVQSLGSQVEQTTQAIEQQSQPQQQLIQDTRDYDAEVADALEVVAEFSQELQQQAEALAQLGGAEQDAVAIMQELGPAEGFLSDVLLMLGINVSKLKNALQDYLDALVAGEEAESAFLAMTDNLALAMADYQLMLSLMNEQTQLTAEEQGTIDTYFQVVGEAIDALNLKMQEGIAAQSTAGEASMQLVAAFQAESDSASGAADAFNTLNDTARNTPPIIDAEYTVFETLGTVLADNADGVDRLTRAYGLLGSLFTDLQTQLGQVNAAFAALVNGEDAAATAAQDEAAALQEDNAMMDMQGFMILQLVQWLLSLSQSFLQAGMDAQTSIAHITGLADQSLAAASGASRLSTVIQTLSSYATQFGVSMKDASDGLYYIISAGFNTSDALHILQYSMETAAATGASMTSVSSALTSILKDYNLSASSAGSITNQMVAAVVAGKQNFQEFANVIGEVGDVASRSGVSFSEAAAAEATMTQQNPRVLRDAQDLMHLFETLAFKTDTIAANAQKLGINFDATSFSSMNLMQKLQYLAHIAGGDTTAAFNKLLTDQTSARAAFMLLVNGGQNYANILQSISTNTNALSVAFQQAQATIAQRLHQVGAALSVVSYELVTMISPVVIGALSALTGFIGFLAQHTQLLLPILTAFAVIVGSLLVTALQKLIAVFAPLIAESMAFALPLAAVGAALAVLIPWIVSLIQHSARLRAQWELLGVSVQILANWVRSRLHTAFAELAPTIQRAGNWFQTVLVPAVDQALLAIMQFAQFLLAKGVPALNVLFLAGVQFANWATTYILIPLGHIIRNVASFAATFGPQIEQTVQLALTIFSQFAGLLLGTILPTIGSLIAGIMQVAVFLSAHLAPILQAVMTMFHLWAAVMAGLQAAGIAAALIPFVTVLIRVGAVLPAIISAIATGLLPVLGALVSSIIPAIIAFVAANAIIVGVGVAIGILVFAILQFTRHTQFAGAIVSMIVAVLRMLWQTLTASLGPSLQSIGRIIQSVLVPAWQHFQQDLVLLLPAIRAFATLIGGVLVAALGIIISVIGGILAALGPFLTGIALVISGVISIISGFISVFTGLFVLIHGIMTLNGNEIRAGWNQLWIGVVDILKGIGSVIIGVIYAIFGAIIGFIVGFITNIINFFLHLKDVLVGHSIIPEMCLAIAQAFLSMATQVIGILTGWIGSLLSSVGSFAARMVSQILTLDSQVRAIFLLLGPLLVSIMVNAMSGIVNAVANGATSVIGRIQSMAASIGGVMRGLIGQAFQWGADFITQMASGIASFAGSVIAQAQNVAANIASFLHFSVPEQGPLAHADRWMEDFGTLLASGLAGQVGRVTQAARNLSFAVASAAPTAQSLASYTPSAVPASAHTQQVQLLQAILAELQKQTAQGTNNMTVRPLSPTTIGSIVQVNGPGNGGQTGILDMYDQLNILSGLAGEFASRGAYGGISL